MTSEPERSALLLGRGVPYVEQYDSSLLQPISRQPQRSLLGIDSNLPFTGVDLWTAYELSWLNPRGKPQIAIVSFSIPATSPNIVESKSFKMYLNSFTQTKMDDAELLATVRSDVSRCVGAPVEVTVFGPEMFGRLGIQELPGRSIDGIDIEIDRYTPDPDILRANPSQVVSEALTSNLLKSNCLVTGQPDWGSVRVSYQGPRIDPESLLRYIVSFRQHHEFHEHGVERMFVDIMRYCHPEKLTVYARYTRRGGLDINPLRTNHSFTDVDLNRTPRQ